MPTQFAFPFSSTFGGAIVSKVFAFPLGNDQWELFWEKEGTTADAAYVIAIDKKLYAVIRNSTSMKIPGEPGATPVVEIAEFPVGMFDPSLFVEEYFTTLPPNKLIVTWDPPASVVGVSHYNVYWDNGTGTVDFTAAGLLTPDGIQEDGSSSYEFFKLTVAGTFKTVVRTVDDAGNETINTTAQTQTVVTFPDNVTLPTIVFNSGPKTATITWVDPSNIGSGNVRIFDNLGSLTDLNPNYNFVGPPSVAAGLQTFTTPALANGRWIFGLRVFDLTNEEKNTHIQLELRIESGVEIVDGPEQPLLEAFLSSAGKINLILTSFPDVGDVNKSSVKAKFFTNDGAGGAIDFGTALGAGFITMNQVGNMVVASLETAVFGETARKFSARSFNNSSVASVDAAEVTITPNQTVPGTPQNAALAAGRN